MSENETQIVEKIREQLKTVAQRKRVKEQMFYYRKEKYFSEFPALHARVSDNYVYKIVFAYDYGYLSVIDCGKPNYCEIKIGDEIKRVKGLWITNQNFMSLQFITYRKDKWKNRPLIPWESWANLRYIASGPPYMIAYYEKAVRAPTIQLNPAVSVFNITFYDFTPYLAYFLNVIIDDDNCLNRATTEDSFHGVETKFERPVYVVADMLAHHFVLVPERTVVRLKQKPTLENPNPPDEEKTIELEEGAYFIP